MECRTFWAWTFRPQKVWPGQFSASENAKDGRFSVLAIIVCVCVCACVRACVEGVGVHECIVIIMHL